MQPNGVEEFRTAVLQTKTDAEAMSRLLDELGHHAWALRLEAP